jgi:hypothetical protein
MGHQVGDTFESIESAHDFVRLLSEAVTEAKQDIAAEVKREQATSKATRRLDALRIALYSLEKLELYMSKSQLILNDLRTLRRLVFEERPASTPKSQLKSAPSTTMEQPVVPLPASLTVGPADAGCPQ